MKDSAESTAHAGFTLIELVAVMVILGILAVVALPRFTNMQGSAREAATDGVAGQLASAFATNFAACAAADASCVAVDNCDDGAALLQGGALPAGYAITGAAIAANATVTCTLTGPGGATATFPASRF